LTSIDDYTIKAHLVGISLPKYKLWFRHRIYVSPLGASKAVAALFVYWYIGSWFVLRAVWVDIT